MRELGNQVAIVTGAGSGIGRAISLALAAQHVSLCLLGRSLEKLQQVADAARMVAPSVRNYQVDLDSDSALASFIMEFRQDVGRLDILVHNAALLCRGELRYAAVEDLDRQYRVNLRAPYVLTQAFLPLLISSKGQVVFINSSAGVTASAATGQYTATKHALKALADTLRQEINAAGVRVLSVFPGRTASPMQAEFQASEGRVYEPERLMQPEDVAAVIVNALTLPATAEVTDISLRPLRKLE